MPLVVITMGRERLHFGRDFFQPQGLHLSTRLEEAFEPIELEDCQIFLLPFIGSY